MKLCVFDFAQVFHYIGSNFDLLNTISKNMSNIEQTYLLNLARL
jgi:C4-dicarboxylate transporter